MKRIPGILMFVVCLMLFDLSPGMAQEGDGDTCPAIVEEALSAVDVLCEMTGRNQACYGHISLEAELRRDIFGVRFEQPGDITDIINLAALRTLPMIEADGAWGVALLRLQANLPDTLPGQNVSVLLFGETQLNPVLPSGAATGIINDHTNIYAQPNPRSGVVDHFMPGTPVEVVGRTEEADWLHVMLDNGRLAWTTADRLDFEGVEIGALPVVNPDQPESLIAPPIQAFYLQTGIGQAPCIEAPPSGILIQTPQGAGQINLTINEVNISLGSTVYLQAQPGGTLDIYVLEGEIVVEALGISQVVPAGAVISVPLDESLRASGPPDNLRPYTLDELGPVPVGALQYDIIIAEAYSDCLISASSAVNLRGGPGVNYPVTGTINAGDSIAPVGQALDSGGVPWLRLPAGEWARIDTVLTSGNCNLLPILSSIPAPPPPPGGAGDDDDDDDDDGAGNFSGEVTNIDPYWHVMACSTTSGSTFVSFSTGSGGWESEADANAHAASVFTSVVIDGQAGPAFEPRGADGPLPEGHPGHPWQYLWNTATITLTPGPHDLFFTRSERGHTSTISCVYTAQ